jgi:hypothetical protein
VKIIEAHGAGCFGGKYSDYAHACAVVWEDEQSRRAAANGPVGTVDALPGAKRRRTHDSATHVHVHLPTTDQQALGSGPELKGARPGNVGASEAWPSDPPILPLEGKAEDYRVIDNPAGGCGLFRRGAKDRKARTGDADRFRARDAAQHSILRGINESNRPVGRPPSGRGSGDGRN